MLDYNQQGHCVTLTINRPDMRNALGEPGDGDVFTEACARINQDRSVRCVILTGAGSAFSAGGNIKAMQEGRAPFGGPGDGGAWLLPRQIGLSRASELLFTGKTIPAETAAEWGLVSEVVDDGALMQTACAMADEICAQSPEALRAAKRLLRNGQSASFDTVMEMSATTQALMHQMSDHQAAISAMLDKAQADYKDE